MALSNQDKERIEALATGNTEPKDGFEKHFVRACSGKGKACTDREREWLAFWRDTQGEQGVSRPGSAAELTDSRRTRELEAMGITRASVRRAERREARRRAQENTGFFASGRQRFAEPLFHKASCGWVAHLDRKRAIRFRTRDEAIESGYRPCRACKP